MKNFFLSLHLVSMSLVIGTLFLQSLTVVFRLRLKKAEEIQGLRKIQNRIHKLIYYPILATTIFSGIYLAVKTELFQKPENWIYWKLTLLAVLISLGVMNGKQIMNDVLPKKYAMMVHIAIFIIGAWMIYLATIKPF
jgi:uncharacterized membrane protein|tara:strand:- start:23 stop:433 length:411 start_codon:yes stop_codon:yes gene_type:complete